MPTAILVVDDDRGNCAVVSRLLAERGYLVDVAYDGLSALEMAENKIYQLAVLDYQMPGMDGIELFERMQRIHPELPGVFLTAYPTINTVFPAIGVGIERVLAKPVDSHELIPLVERLVGKAG